MRLDYPRPYVPFTEGFPTPRGKLEFFSETARADGHDPLPGYVPPAQSGDHPLALIAPASHWFLNSMFANKPDLMKKAGGPRIEIHADDAEPSAARARATAPASSTPAAASRPRSRSPTASAPA